MYASLQGKSIDSLILRIVKESSYLTFRWRRSCGKSSSSRRVSRRCWKTKKTITSWRRTVKASPWRSWNASRPSKPSRWVLGRCFFVRPTLNEKFYCPPPEWAKKGRLELFFHDFLKKYFFPSILSYILVIEKWKNGPYFLHPVDRKLFIN